MNNEDVLKYIDSMKIDKKQERIATVNKNIEEDVVTWDKDIDDKPNKKQTKGTIKKIANEFIDELFSDEEQETTTQDENTQDTEEQEDPKRKIPEKLTQELVEEYLREYYFEEREKRDSYQKQNLSVTDLVSCVRKVYFEFKNTERRPTYIYPFGEIVTSYGDITHAILQKRIPSMHVEEKIKINDKFDFPISFRMDIHLNDKVLVEIKNVESLPEKPKKEHAKQAILYAYFLNTYLGYDFDLVQLVYVARGKIKVKIFDIQINDSILKKVDNMVKSYIETLKYHMNMDVPPPLTDKYVDKSQCIFCDYNYICNSKQKYKSYSSTL